MDLSWWIWERNSQLKHVVLEPDLISQCQSQLFCLSMFYCLFPKLRQGELCAAITGACTAALQRDGSPNSCLGNITPAPLQRLTPTCSLLRERPARRRPHHTSHRHQQPSSWTLSALHWNSAVKDEVWCSLGSRPTSEIHWGYLWILPVSWYLCYRDACSHC